MTNDSIIIRLHHFKSLRNEIITLRSPHTLVKEPCLGIILRENGNPDPGTTARRSPANPPGATEF
ncbi:hypothetical protein KC19_N031200 [Ceratodon purpureus]|nr:hypothetical protein KC19_N031200 [Ceratodon purpureus]